MGKNKVIVIGHNLKDKEAIYTYLASREAEVIVVDSMEEAQKLSGDTTYPEIKPSKPFVITAPKIYERTFEDYRSGREKRRERRVKERNSR